MKRLKLEIPGILLFFSGLIICKEFERKDIRYIIISICIVGIIGLAYSTIKDIIGYIEKITVEHNKEFAEITDDLTASVKEYKDAQKDCIDKLISAVDGVRQSTETYREKVEALSRVQKEAVNEEQKLKTEIENLGKNLDQTLSGLTSEMGKNLTDIVAGVKSAYDLQQKLFENSLSEMKKQQQNHESRIEKIAQDEVNRFDSNIGKFENNIETKMDNFYKDSKDARTTLNEEVKQDLKDTKEAMNALKSQVRVSLDKLSKAMSEQTNAITDGLDDCSDEIGNKLDDFNKKQSERDNVQNKKLNEEICKIGTTVSERVENVLKANKQLMEYIEQVQKEWTTLSKDEIAFLEKVWKE